MKLLNLTSLVINEVWPKVFRTNDFSLVLRDENCVRSEKRYVESQFQSPNTRMYPPQATHYLKTSSCVSLEHASDIIFNFCFAMLLHLL